MQWWLCWRDKRRIEERIKGHNSKDNSSHLFKHARENGHSHVWKKDFQVLGNNFQSNFKRKISESLFIKQLKPTLNVNEKSITLHLFNWFIIAIILIEDSSHWFVQTRYQTQCSYDSCCLCIIFNTMEL